ncbi:MAG: hypothetical protein A2X12_07800 [Bacteroidetes bacterium GWE2_29_8]|nr:MAG: hypothetical protein A2X12_07800 [Bacteroidetes bacterium GWE2_29_8]OFY20371.1 MAG: hypothetical protein A2X02_08955 [Bacteroidetes bacterium GWF2_29_10]
MVFRDRLSELKARLMYYICALYVLYMCFICALYQKLILIKSKKVIGSFYLKYIIDKKEKLTFLLIIKIRIYE